MLKESCYVAVLSVILGLNNYIDFKKLYLSVKASLNQNWRIILESVDCLHVSILL